MAETAATSRTVHPAGWPGGPASVEKRLTGRDRLLLLAATLLTLVPGTFGVSLVDRDEGWYAQVSREMLTRGDWIIPTYLGEPWIAKPPLLYWCVAAAYAVFGVHVWAARLVSVLAMTGAVQLVGSLAAEMYGRRVAWIAGLTFITAGLPAIVGKMLLTDPLLLLCCMGATLLLWRLGTRGVTWAGAAGFWCIVGVGILAKGPAIGLFVGAFALALLTRRETRAWCASGRFWTCLPLAAVVAGPWYVAAARQAGGTLVHQFFGYEIVSRLTGAPHGHGGPPGYYVLLSLAGWLPWTALVPGAVLEAWAVRRRDRAAWILLIWLGLPWVLLELVPSKLPHYILPCCVPLAILFGRMWVAGVAAPGAEGRPAARPQGTSLTALQRAVLYIWVAVPVALGAGLVAAGVAWRGYAWSWAAIGGGSWLAAGFIVVTVAVARRRLMRAWRQALGVTVVFHVLLGTWLLPGFEPYRLSRNVAEAANAFRGRDTRVLVLGGSKQSFTEPSMYFYLEPPAKEVDAEAVRAALASGERGFMIIGRDETLRAAGIEPDATRPGWHPVSGFNYVKGERVMVWVIDGSTPPAERQSGRELSSSSR